MAAAALQPPSARDEAFPAAPDQARRTTGTMYEARAARVAEFSRVR